MFRLFCVCSLWSVARFAAAGVIDADICVYGGTSGGVAAAVQGVRMGKSVSLAVFGEHLGGLSSGGLGATDVGNPGSIGGVSREFYRRIGQRYNQPERFNFEPRVAREVFAAWLAEIGVAPRYHQRLTTVTRAGQRITEIRMEDGTVYRARMFIDATYEGDLMAMAGVSFTFGREGTNVYGETLNGIRASTPAHQFGVNVDPYVVPGQPGSGLLPFVQPGDGGTPGDGDHRIQAFNYRLCFTQNATNRLPHAVPPNYDPVRYELLGRLLDARAAAGETLTINNFFSVSSMPNGKTDMNNNGAFSTDYIGMNWTYPTNSYEARERLDRDHLEYIQGLIQYLAASPRSPASLRAQMLSWGPCKDEWTATGGYSPQIYVREARRMVSDYVMTQGDCQSARVASDSVCLGAYNMDSHNCQRVVKNGYARNEGDVQVGASRPYPIAYRSIVPRTGECENVFVTFAISASHIAFGSTRMEPVFMMAGQSAATAAAFAINDRVPVQQVDYAKLALQLAADGQVLTWGGADLATNGAIVDNLDAGAVFSGYWSNSASVAGYWGVNYAHDDNTGKGVKTATFTPNLPTDGEYRVLLRWTTHANRATNVPVDIAHAAGTTTVLVNQTLNNGTWVELLRTNFATTGGRLRVRTTGTTGYVVADAARWVSATVPPTVQLIATDPVASETGKVARVTFVRSQEETNMALTVRYRLSGTASNGVDIASLSGSVVMPDGSISTSLVIQALSDSFPEGDKLLVIELEPGTNYVAGAFSNALVQVLDTPWDAWRFAHFSPLELEDPEVSGPSADPDGDGASNLHEFQAGTNPRKAASVFRLGVAGETNAVWLSFPGVSGREYSLEYRQEAAAGPWLALTNFPRLEGDGVLRYSDQRSPGATNRFYRANLR